MATTVIEALRRFLPAYLERNPALDTARRRAVWAITHCRTAAMGGHLHACPQCETRQFRFHSCNHRSCPQCGRQDTAAWVQRELGKRVGAPTFMVTFTLPEPLRRHFLGAAAAPMYRLFFDAASSALADTLANPRWLGASFSGFTLVLHTWNQRLGFHPHLHAIVPGAGLGADGRVVTVKSPRMLVPQKALVRIFRARFRDALRSLQVRQTLPSVDPALWRQPWGVHLQSFGSGETLIKYLGAYVCRTAIGDSRIVAIGDQTVSFRWKDRARGGVLRIDTLAGTEFVARYLRHVLPRGLRAIRHYGFCHPAARAKRERIAFHTGRPLVLADPGSPPPDQPATPPTCPDCGCPMQPLLRLLPDWRIQPTTPSCENTRSRAPPSTRSCA